MRNSKHDPMLEEEGKETTVSTKHLAPYGQRDIPDETVIEEVPGNSNSRVDDMTLAKSIDNNNVSIELPDDQISDHYDEVTESNTVDINTNTPNVHPLRTSSRISKPPDR